MILRTKWKLTFWFSLLIIAFSLLILLISYLYVHQSILQGLERDMLDDGMPETIDYYQEVPLNQFHTIEEDEIIEIFANSGKQVAETLNSLQFATPLNQKLFDRAKQGYNNFEVVNVRGTRHLILYFPLSKLHVGRIAEPMLQVVQYEDNFLKLILISLPAILLLAFLLSQWLVNLAIQPITEAFRFQENFSSNVSHELQTPLAGIKGHLEVSLRRDRSPEEYKEFINKGLEAVNRVIAVLNDLYLLASSNFKRLSLYQKQVDLKFEIEDIVDTFGPFMDDKELSIDLENLPSLICICDEILIHRTFTNLISNAVKYTPKQGHITISGEIKGNWINVTMQNDCEGLVNYDIQNLFNPFYRGQNTKDNQIEGKGLGLNISNYIILSHGGKLTASLPSEKKFQLLFQLPKLAKDPLK